MSGVCLLSLGAAVMDVRLMDLVNAVGILKVATTNVFICGAGYVEGVVRK
jgi:hypothetical protein